MNKTIAIIVFVLLVLISFELSAKDSTYQMVIYRGETVISTFKNFDKFDFDDTSGNQKSGRIKMINDSQFYFVNYFYERGSRTYHLNEIKELVGINRMNKTGGKRMYISAPTAILVALFVPFGAYYLLFREIYLTIKEGPGHSKRKERIETSLGDIKIVINKIPAGS